MNREILFDETIEQSEVDAGEVVLPVVEKIKHR